MGLKEAVSDHLRLPVDPSRIVVLRPGDLHPGVVVRIEDGPLHQGTYLFTAQDEGGQQVIDIQHTGPLQVCSDRAGL